MEKHTKTVSRITGDVKCSCGYFYCEEEPEDEPTIRHIEDVDERHLETTVCPRCKGTGEVEGQIPNLYANGYMDDVPLVCNVCDGKGEGRAVDMEDGERLYDWANAPTLDELRGRPTITIGHTADLKLERYEENPSGGDMLLVRYWLNRVGPADGEHYKVDVEARTCPNGTWAILAKLYPYSRWHTMQDRAEG